MSSNSINNFFIDTNLLENFVNNHLNNPEVFLETSDSNLNLKNDITKVIKHLFDHGNYIYLSYHLFKFLIIE